jgi:glycosyltransferase involved in cell wall biosynthesis
MRIALVNNYFAPRPSGSAHLTEELAFHYTRLGHHVLVLTAAYADAPAFERRDGYEIVRLPAWKMPELAIAFGYDIRFAMSPGNVRRAFRLLDDFRPDVVHQHGQFFDLAFISSAYARRRGIAHVTSVHARLEHPDPVYGGLFRVADASIIRGSLALAHSDVVVMDKLMRRYVRRRYHVPDSRLHGIPIGVDLDRFAAPAGVDDVRERYGLDDRPVILSVGHVTPFRNRVALMRALPHLVQLTDDFQVVIVGELHDREFLTIADELRVAGRIVVTGPVPRRDVAALLAVADVEVHDLQRQGLGTASLEAIAAGVPVVSDVEADNFPGVTLVDGEHIVIVPPDEPRELARALGGLLGDPARRREIAASGRAFVREHFGIDRIAALHLEMYCQIVGGARRDPGAGDGGTPSERGRVQRVLARAR